MSASTLPVEPLPDELRARYAHIIAAYGEATFQRMRAAKVLVVGAGGIGCELLKNLVLSGFRHLTVLDLDTIDVSNLNRQFLFRRPHVGLSKARVAVDAVRALLPGGATAKAAADIHALHDNIKSPQYDHDFFSSFTLVMNALDNLEARRHVNRLCLSAGRTLLESGTQGYAGQTTAIVGGATECFECAPVPSAKTFAVCTIRNTPDKPVHAVVWAKSVYAAIFGEPDEGNIMADARIDLVQAVEQERDVAARAGHMTIDAHVEVLFSPFARLLFTRLFDEEIRKQCEVKERWKDRAPPTPLQLQQLMATLHSASASASGHGHASGAAIPSPLTSAYFRQRDQSVFTPAENALFLLHTIRCLLLERTSELGQLSFDKDDELSMDFVSAAANLRMANFGIPMQSRFAAKGIAGNIVHAIATTNAIAAGLMVVEAVKLLDDRRDQCHTTWITRRGPALLTAQQLNKPNPDCFVCAHSVQELTLDTNTWTLKRLFAAVLKQKLSMNEPSIDVINRDNFIGTEDDHADSPAYLNLPLSSAGVRIDHGSMLSVEDQSQHLAVRLRIVHREQWNEEEQPELFILTKGDKHKDDASTTAADAATPTPADATAAAASLPVEPVATPAAAAAAVPALATPDEQKQEPVPAAAAMDLSEPTPASAAAAPAPAPSSGSDTSSGSGSHKRKFVEVIDGDEDEAAIKKKLRADATDAEADVIELD